MSLFDQNKAEICAALRSGKYNQERRRLCSSRPETNALCCIGVAYATVFPQMPIWAANADCHSNLNTGDAGRALGLTDAEFSGMVCGNDQLNYGFDKIADGIESGEFLTWPAIHRARTFEPA